MDELTACLKQVIEAMSLHNRDEMINMAHCIERMKNNGRDFQPIALKFFQLALDCTRDPVAIFWFEQEIDRIKSKISEETAEPIIKLGRENRLSFKNSRGIYLNREP